MRKKRYSKKIISKMKKLYINGKSHREIAKILNIHQQSIWNHVKNIPLNKRKNLPKNYNPKIIIPKSSKKLSKEKARIIGYISADGYISKKLHNKKIIYYGPKIKIGYTKANRYYIAFYNKDKKVINKFISDFYKVYKVKLKYNLKKIEVKTTSIEIYKDLIKYTKYGSRKWKIPSKILANKNFKREWLKVFCDCEAHIDNYKKYHKLVIISSVNKKGLQKIQNKILKDFKINSYINGPYEGCFRLKIAGKDNLIKFRKEIGFYHPSKIKKLNKVISKYSN